MIACISPAMIQRITNYAKHKEFAASAGGYIDYETGEILTKADHDTKYEPDFPETWRFFRSELEARLSDDPAAKLAAMRLESYPDPSSVILLSN